MQTSIKMGSFQHVPIVPAVQSAPLRSPGGPVHSRRFQTFNHCAQFKTLNSAGPSRFPRVNSQTKPRIRKRQRPWLLRIVRGIEQDRQLPTIRRRFVRSPSGPSCLTWCRRKCHNTSSHLGTCHDSYGSYRNQSKADVRETRHPRNPRPCRANPQEAQRRRD
jgi:hypothetical protein